MSGASSSRNQSAAIVAISLAVAMSALDTAVTNTALPTITAELKSTPADAVWIVSVYQLAMASTLLPLASAGEVWGHKRVFVSGLALFTVASLACGLAPSLPALIVARGLQGLGGAAIMSTNLALVRFIYPPQALGRGFGVNALVLAMGLTAGPTVASLVLSVTSWPWLFLVNVPVGALALLLAWRALPATKLSPHPFDPVAAALCATFLGCSIWALGEGAHGGSWATVFAKLTIALGAAAGLAWRQRGHPAPLLALDLFGRPVFTISTTAAFCAFATQGFGFVGLPFFFQAVLHRSQVETGFLMTPWTAVGASLAPFAGRLSDRHAPSVLGGFGLGVLAVGMAALASLAFDAGAGAIVGCMALCGVGFAFFQAPNLRAMMASVPADRSGAASGMIGTVRLLGQTTGAMLVGFCLSFSPTSGSQAALLLGATAAACGAAISLSRLLLGRKP